MQLCAAKNKAAGGWHYCKPRTTRNHEHSFIWPGQGRHRRFHRGPARNRSGQHPEHRRSSHKSKRNVFFYIVIFKKLFYLQPYFWSKLCLPVVVLWIYICADLLVHLKVGWIFKLAQVSPWDLVNRIKSVSNYLQINKIWTTFYSFLGFATITYVVVVKKREYKQKNPQYST